jgi:hypothetical protein
MVLRSPGAAFRRADCRQGLLRNKNVLFSVEGGQVTFMYASIPKE